MSSAVVSSDATDSVAVYLNSSLEDSANTNANKIDFRFVTPINPHDGVAAYVTLSQFTAFNTFASISAAQLNNVVKVVNVMYNALTGVYDCTTYLQRYVIPDNRYTAVTLFALLNANLTKSVLPQGFQVGEINWYSNETTTDSITTQYSYLYLGMGFDGLNNMFTSTPVEGFALDPDDEGRVAVSAATFEGNTNGNAYQKQYISGYGGVSSDPLVYAGVYLVVDDETAGFMTSLGFIGKGVSANFIPNTPYKGFGFTFPITASPAPPPPPPISGAFAYQLFGPWMLYFCLDGLTVNTRCNDEQLDQSNIIGCVPVEAFYGGLISYQLTAPQFQRFKSPADFTTFTISIYDQNKMLVNFRGGSWTAKLDFHFEPLPDYNLIQQPLYPTIDDAQSRGNLHKRSLPDGQHDRGRNLLQRSGFGGRGRG